MKLLQKPILAGKSKQKAHTAQVVVVIERSAIHLFRSDEGTVASVTFPADVVNDLEVIDEKKLQKIVRDVVIEQRARHLPTVLFLSNSFVFVKPLSAEAERSKVDSEIRQQEADIFVQDLPFEDVVIKPLKLHKQTVLLAVNFILYETLLQALSEARLDLKLVLPLTVLPAEHAKKMALIADYYHKYADNLKQYALWQPEASDDDDEELVVKPKAAGSNKVLLVALAGMMVLLVGVLWWANQRDQAREKERLDARQKQQEQQQQKKTSPTTVPSVQVTPSPSPATSSTPIPTPTATSAASSVSTNSSISILIENGSGVPGQASEVAELVERSGFTNVSVANASQQLSGPTLIRNKDSVSTQDLQRLAAVFTAANIEFVIRSASADQVTDVVILTAQPR